MWSATKPTSEDQAENDYKYSTESEDLLLKEPSDRNRLLVGAESSSKRNHLPSHPPANQKAPSAHDPTAHDTAATNASSGRQTTTVTALPEHQYQPQSAPKPITASATADGRFFVGDAKMNNSNNVNNSNNLRLTDSSLDEGLTTHVRRSPGKARAGRCSCREKILLLVAALLALLLILFIFLYARAPAGKTFLTPSFFQRMLPSMPSK